MDLFEFLMVLVSIIVGLGLAELLTGIAQLLRTRGATRYYWVHGVLSSIIFVALLQQWWETWELRTAGAWSFIALLLMLVGPICLFLMAHLLFPRGDEAPDLETYYYGPMRPVWILGAVAIVGSTLFRPLVFGYHLIDPGNITSFLGLIAFIILFVTCRRSVHAVIVPFALLALMYDVLRWAPVLGR